jgi:amino-acid N-acetyltransferase
MSDPMLRTATMADANALFALIGSQIEEGHLLPRALAELRRHASRFVVCEIDGEIKACGELTPLSPAVAEIRSLVVASDFRRVGLAARLVTELTGRARLAGFDTLAVFTHDPRFFVGQNFSIVPHLWVPEKIRNTCLSCPLFGRCAQFAMVQSIDAVRRHDTPAAVVGRVGVA